jgi:hypothetical protein
MRKKLSRRIEMHQITRTALSIVFSLAAISGTPLHGSRQQTRKGSLASKAKNNPTNSTSGDGNPINLLCRGNLFHDTGGEGRITINLLEREIVVNHSEWKEGESHSSGSDCTKTLSVTDDAYTMNQACTSESGPLKDVLSIDRSTGHVIRQAFYDGKQETFTAECQLISAKPQF